MQHSVIPSSYGSKRKQAAELHIDTQQTPTLGVFPARSRIGPKYAVLGQPQLTH